MTRRGMWGAGAAVVAALAIMPAAGHAQTWRGALTGNQQVPRNDSPGTGFATITLTGNQLEVAVNWAGVVGGPVEAGHIHCCTMGSAAGNNVGVAVPFAGLVGGTSGTYMNTFNLLDGGVYTGGFLGMGSALDARNALIAGLNGGRAYVNLHNDVFPGGEIRANVALVTPEPSTFALAAAGAAGLGLAARRRRRA